MSSAPLDVYIRRARGTPEAHIFDRSSHVQTPTLIRGQVNRVLTYRGAFNPPHQGHKDTLCHGFFRGGADLNLIAAILFFLDDRDVIGKYEETNDGVKSYVLTKDERIGLFNHGGMHGGWHWCHPGGIREYWDFLRQLRFEAGRDGFEIRFITLCGLDHVDIKPDALQRRRMTIVAGTGDPERAKIRTENEAGFRKLRGFGDWQVQKPSETFIQQLGSEGSPEWLEQKLSMLAPGQAKDLPTDRKCTNILHSTTANHS